MSPPPPPKYKPFLCMYSNWVKNCINHRIYVFQLFVCSLNDNLKYDIAQDKLLVCVCVHVIVSSLAYDLATCPPGLSYFFSWGSHMCDISATSIYPLSTTLPPPPLPPNTTTSTSDCGSLFVCISTTTLYPYPLSALVS